MTKPLATYRLQFNPDFGFVAAKAIVDYLAALGVSTVYASPIFKARRGSTHGYDVTDPTQLNPELGTAESFDALIKTVQQHGLIWLQDFVPNHMAYDSRNRMLMDVFEKGPGSPYYAFFDILWDHLRENLRGKVIAPFLGKPYAETLESGELTLQYGNRNFSVKYYDSVYPLRIESYATVISHQLNELKDRLGADDPDFIKMLGIVVVLTNLADDPKADPLSRTAQMLLARDALWTMYHENPAVREFVDRRVQEFNSDINLLDGTLTQQWFQFTYWRVATKEINYQRFFNINELISLRMEDERVFDHVHRFALSLLNEGRVHGLRIDHVDGLYNPTEYVERLRRHAPGAYLVVEKILELSEQLPGLWRVEGTTGYDFLNYVNELFVDAANERRFQQIYSSFSGAALEYDDLLYEKKKLMIERHLTGDLDNLTSLLKTISTTTRDGIDLAWEALMQAITEAAAVFPVYRTYINGNDEISEQERRHIAEAIDKARVRNPTLERALDFLHSVLLLDYPEHLADNHRVLWLDFVMRFQQFTSPLMAKGLEDTTFYVFNRLVSLNEVGGNPGRFGISVDEFHESIARRARSFPHTMNATATHDTKRGEDMRARINVLSEMPDEWQRHIERWHEINKPLKRTVQDEEVPDCNREYFLYQTLVGVWPFADAARAGLVERMKQYVIKAAREAKTHTFWLDNNTEYEEALLDFTEKMLTASPDFLESFTAFQQRVAHYGIFNSLAQTLIKLTAPGVPDLYQGTELWDLSLVDPDNRRPVDYEQRRQMLDALRLAEKDTTALINELLASREDGRIKLFVVHRVLQARREYRDLFEQGDYVPLRVTGHHAARVIAFARQQGEQLAVTIAPRLLVPLIGEDELPTGEVWRDTAIELPEGASAAWRNVFTDEAVNAPQRLALADALRRFPVALLVNEMKG